MICNCTLPYINPKACENCPTRLQSESIHYNPNGTIDHINTNFEILMKQIQESRDKLNLVHVSDNDHKIPHNCNWCHEDYYFNLCDKCGKVRICEDCYSIVLEYEDDPFSQLYVCSDCANTEKT